MRTKSKASGVVEVYNLGSKAGASLDFSRAKLWQRMTSSLRHKAVSIPVFLVNESQMDGLYPPERRQVLEPEMVKKWANRRRDWIERTWRDEDERRIKELLEEDPFRELEPSERAWERYKITVAVGLYNGTFKEGYKLRSDVLGLGDREVISDQSSDKFIEHSGPAIFICAERVEAWANRERVPIQPVLDKVYYHELAHAVMDTGDMPYNEIWCRTIEEALANRVALNRFSGVEAGLIQKLIKEQSAEYQACVWIENAIIKGTWPMMSPFWLPYPEFEYWVRRWRKLDWDEFIWWYHRRFRWIIKKEPLFVTYEAPALVLWIQEVWTSHKGSNFLRDPDVTKIWKLFAAELLMQTGLRS